MSWQSSVVQILGTDLVKGTGTFISPTEILTAAHVVTRDGELVPLPLLRVDIREKGELVFPRALAVLPSWTNGMKTGSDIALVKVDPHPELGVPPVFDVPAPAATAMLECMGFEAQNDTKQVRDGNVECRVGTAGERHLYSQDITPVGGMSGGPIYTPQSSGVHIAGILIRASNSKRIGLGVTSTLLAKLRSQLDNNG